MAIQLLHPSDTNKCDNSDDDYGPVVNPATNLPMVDKRIGSIDIGGSPYGQNTSQVFWTSQMGGEFE